MVCPTGKAIFIVITDLNDGVDETREQRPICLPHKNPQIHL